MEKKILKVLEEKVKGNKLFSKIAQEKSLMKFQKKRMLQKN